MEFPFYFASREPARNPATNLRCKLNPTMSAAHATPMLPHSRTHHFVPSSGSVISTPDAATTEHSAMIHAALTHVESRSIFMWVFSVPLSGEDVSEHDRAKCPCEGKRLRLCHVANTPRNVLQQIVLLMQHAYLHGKKSILR